MSKPSPRSSRPSADVQAAREAASVDKLKDRLRERRERVREAIEDVMVKRICRKSSDFVALQESLREALVQVEILIEQTAKLEKAERANL